MIFEVLGIVFSILYILCVIWTSTILLKKKLLNQEQSRKFIHILTSNYVVIQYLFNQSLICAVFVPFLFVLINSISYKYNIIKSMERQGDSSKGTIWYVVSATIITAFSYYVEQKEYLLIVMLTLGYSDGFGAIIGRKYGKHYFPNKKTIEGSLAVCGFSVVPVFICSLFGIVSYDICLFLSIAVFVTVAEAFTSNGFDNITVPLITVFVLLMFGESNYTDILYVGSTLGIVLLISWYKSALSLSATLLAFFMMICIYVFSGFYALMSVLIFFISGSFFSKVSNQKKEAATVLHKRKGRRTCCQVLANGIITCFYSFAYAMTNDPKFFYAIFVSMAVATADTLSSEIGMMCRGKTLSILTFKPIQPGLSGGVSATGILGGIMGSLCIALLPITIIPIHISIVIAVLGIIGSLIDSFLGATLQIKYLSLDGSLTEVDVLPNGHRAEVVTGIKWINNDTVNFLSILIVSMLSLALF